MHFLIRRLCLMLILALALLCVATKSTFAQSQASAQMPSYRIYNGATGKPAAITDIVEAMRAVNVVFIGEQHNDPTAHRLELKLLQAAQERYAGSSAANTAARLVALSLEMFERDVQTELNEYLAGLIIERQFLLSSRPWSNYASDYRPLIEFARDEKLSVIAANAPERYVNRVSRLGAGSLKELSLAAKTWLAPLPYAAASEAYAAKFNSFMSTDQSVHATHGGAAHLLEAQALRDATMAFSIAEKLKAEPKALVLHVNGSFHSAGRLGTPEQLLLYRPQARLMVIDIVSGDSGDGAPAAGVGLSNDFLIITDSTVSRSF
jgi:uncharacterized iron-regulated protein